MKNEKDKTVISREVSRNEPFQARKGGENQGNRRQKGADAEERELTCPRKRKR